MTSQTEFAKYLQIASKEIVKELKLYAKQMEKQTTEEAPELKRLLRQFTNSFFGGKMLRGTLVQLGYELAAKPNSEIFKPAIAFEILHTSLLMHDDIIDQSPLRRGKPAIHIHKEVHYGISQAICLGDLGIVLAHKLIANSNFTENRKNKALLYFSKVIADTILGEMLDVSSAQTMKRAQKQILTIQRMKTAQYTIVGPLSLGAILAGASDDLLKSIKQFGELLGTAYQIQDDILGVFGDEKTIGKSTTSDIEENKSTLLIAHALSKGSKQQIAVLTKLYGKKITLKQHEEMKKIFTNTGSLNYSQNKIKVLTAKAKTIIPQLVNEKKTQALLSNFVDMLIARQK